MKSTEPPTSSSRLVAQSVGRRLLGIALILGGIGWLLFELFSRGTIAGIDVQVARVDSAQAIPVQRFTVTRVEVTGVNDQVVLNGASGEEVVLSGERRGFGWAANAAASAAAQIQVVAEQRGDTLYIDVRRQSWAPWSFGRNPYARLELALPPDVTFDVSLGSGEVSLRQTVASGTVTTVSGRVNADGAGGDLTINTTSGAIELRDQRGSLQCTTVSGDLFLTGQLDNLIAQTTSGDVTVRGAANVAQIKTVSGQIVVDTAITRQLALDSGSGAITFIGQLAAGQHRIQTISGDIAITLRQPDVDLAFSTVSGQITVPDALAAQVVNRRSLTATLGEGGAQVQASSTAGNITLALET
ncbi:DUF4097 family beta strand repeat-containing protein [Chloroflexus sp.]|uniref:DUF4097 family beta strand repeat-containing protein n=1 Tax=Chloroflexus sp. TaxID=1904827 RepID=UPI00262B312E|nr:DUF4097 family beta strand repeat-containing protein [uncultured Chloroflexus sp.]